MPLPPITVIMAVHAPDEALLARQIESLAAQTGVDCNAIAVVNDVSLRRRASARAMLERAGIFTISFDAALGTRTAFEAGLAAALALPEPRLFAYADQDDAWFPEKLAVTAAALVAAHAELAYCDARVVTRTGAVVHPSLHRFESRQHADTLVAALVLNAVSGMTSVFTAATARLAAKLMGGEDSSALHDHLTAVAAAALGRIVRVDAALADYVQHGANVVGARPLAPRPRRWTAEDIALFRQTSRRIFEDRRPIAEALAREGVAGKAITRMFLNRSMPTFALEAAKLAARGQYRRARLLLRMMDGAWQAGREGQKG